MTTQAAVAKDVTKEKLVADLKLLVSDTDELLRATAAQAGEKAAVAREHIQASLSAARERLADAERVALEKSKLAAKTADGYVHENPWAAVGIAAAAALVVGVLIGRR
jgi:ElaB/YqjD/DUF883 family membrane-anchored ribosome-binding protein